MIFYDLFGPSGSVVLVVVWFGEGVLFELYCKIDVPPAIELMQLVQPLVGDVYLLLGLCRGWIEKLVFSKVFADGLVDLDSILGRIGLARPKKPLVKV